jgi:hypothetical protein
MADIPVKPRKTGPPLWLWFVLALVIAAAAWLALDFFGDEEVDGDVELDGREEGPAPETGAHGAPAVPLPLALPLPVLRR